jgi:hypothetical protein
MAAPQKCGHFLNLAAARNRAAAQVVYKGMDTINDDKIDRIGRAVSSIVLSLLAAMFAYGYLSPIFG